MCKSALKLAKSFRGTPRACPIFRTYPMAFNMKKSPILCILQQSLKKSKLTVVSYKTLAPAAAPRPNVIVLEDGKKKVSQRSWGCWRSLRIIQKREELEEDDIKETT